MSIFMVLICLAVLVLLIAKVKLNPFLSFLIVSILAGLLLGVPIPLIAKSVQTGIGEMLGELVIVVVAGAMLGKLVADSGAAQQITSGMMKIFGEKYVQIALMITGFVIGIPLFYTVGFVLVIPLIFSVAYRYNLPAAYIGLPMITSLSVIHGFLPPHPSPSTLVGMFHADMGTTLLYGMIIAIPTVLIAGLLFSQTLKNIHSPILKTFQTPPVPENELPSLSVSILSALLPVVLLLATTIISPYLPADGFITNVFIFFSQPPIVLLISLAAATYLLGIRTRMTMNKIMIIYGDAVKDIAMILLIMGGAGGLKQILKVSGVSEEIATALGHLNVHPLFLGWIVACVIRICVGSATVAGVTAAGLMMPFIGQPGVNTNLMVLSIGAGSLMFSHVNDAGFWLFKEYFSLSIKDTLRSWSIMETLVALCGLVGVLSINFFIS